MNEKAAYNFAVCGAEPAARSRTGGSIRRAFVTGRRAFEKKRKCQILPPICVSVVLFFFYCSIIVLHILPGMTKDRYVTYAVWSAVGENVYQQFRDGACLAIIVLLYYAVRRDLIRTTLAFRTWRILINCRLFVEFSRKNIWIIFVLKSSCFKQIIVEFKLTKSYFKVNFTLNVEIAHQKELV